MSFNIQRRRGQKVRVFLFLSALSLLACSDDSTDGEDDKCLTPPSFSVMVTADSPCGENVGSFEIDATDENLNFQVDQALFSQIRNYVQLNPGTYVITARDQNGCTSEEKVVISSGVSLSTTVQPIIAGHCAIGSCHTTGNQAPDLSVPANIRSAATRLKGQIAEGSMPPPDAGIELSDEDRRTIICWVEDGAPNN